MLHFMEEWTVFTVSNSVPKCLYVESQRFSWLGFLFAHGFSHPSVMSWYRCESCSGSCGTKWSSIEKINTMNSTKQIIRSPSRSLSLMGYSFGGRGSCFAAPRKYPMRAWTHVYPPGTLMSRHTMSLGPNITFCLARSGHGNLS